MKKYFFPFFFLLSQLCFAQNLVPNYSFEVYDTCPNGPGLVRYAIPWLQPSLGTTDYFNACWDSSVAWFGNVDVPNNIIGYQYARTGNAYGGFFAAYPTYDTLNYREYLEVKLSSPLQAGITYYISFWVSLADSSNYATDDIQLHLSNDTIKNDTSYLLIASSQISNASGNFITDKLNWTQIKGEYIALGGEEFITIGNFLDDLNTDTVFVLGGGNINNDNLGYYYLDDVCVSNDSIICYGNVGIVENILSNIIIVFPNPVKDFLFIRSAESILSIAVYNSLGQVVYESRNTGHLNFSKINFLSFSNGIYSITIRTINKIISKKIILNK